MFVAEDVIKVDKEYFFAAKDINAICKFDETKRKNEILYTDPDDDIWAFRRYARVFRYADLLIFPPMWASKFLIYDIKNNSFKTKEIKKIDGFHLDYFFSGKVVGDKLVLAGCQYPVIAVIDLPDFNIHYYEEPLKEMLEVHRRAEDCFFRYDMVSVEQTVYVASCISNKILEFNVESGKYSWHAVGKEENRYSGIAWDGGKMWLSPRRKTNIVCWDLINNEVKEIENPIKYFSEEERNKCTFLGAVYDGKNIILPGMQTNQTVIIDRKLLEAKIVNARYVFYHYQDGLNYALNENGILEIYKPGEYEKPQKTITTKNDKALRAKLIHETGEIIHEGYKEIQLNDFINMVGI